jgi:hypothetical protein
LSVNAAADGSFQADLAAGAEGDAVEINASYLDTKKVGPSVTVYASFPFSWGIVNVAGTGPTARQGHTAVYDPVGHRMVVFGGCGNTWGFGSTYNDVFSLSLASGSEVWTELAPGGGAPQARFVHAAAYDSQRHRMLVFGGDTGAFSVLNDVWALDLTQGAEAWTALNPTGTPPSARAESLAVFDPVGKRLLVFGGRDAGLLGATHFSDVHALNLPDAGTPSWELLSPGGVGPTARAGTFGVLDAGGNRVVAGFGTDGTLYYPETYTLDLTGSAWAPVLSSPVTSGRAGACAALDSNRQRVLVFGGRGATDFYDDLHAFDLGTGSWSSLVPEGASPGPRSRASMVFDPVLGRAVIFGGLSDSAVLDGLFQVR